MIKKVGVISLIFVPFVFVSQAPNQIESFDPDAFEQTFDKESTVTFQYVFPQTFEKNTTSFSYLWDSGAGDVQTRNFDSNFTQLSKIQDSINQNPNLKARFQQVYNNQCYNYRNCNNWYFSVISNLYWENYVKNNTFEIPGTHYLDFLNTVNLRIRVNNNQIFDMGKKLNEQAMEKLGQILHAPNNSRFRIQDISYKIDVSTSANYFSDFWGTLTLKYSYHHIGIQPDLNLKNFLETTKTRFNNEVVSKNTLNINKRIDVEPNRVISLDEQIQKSVEVINEKLANFSRELNDDVYNSRIEYIILDNKNLAFVIKFNHPQNKNRYTYLLNPKVKIVFLPSVYELSQELEKRLILTPSKIYKEDNRYELVDDEPKQIEEPEPTTRKDSYGFTYGGKWEFHNSVDVSFFASKQENEILYINNQPVDVLDQNFHFNLEDLRLSQKESLEAINEYKIEIKQFDKNSNEQENEQLLAVYQIDVVIKSANSVLDIKWFAWNPDKNIEQKKLITPYLTDENGEFLLDSLGNRVDNPDFDPLLDPKTGTKKEIVWVSIGSNLDNLPMSTFFNQLPDEIKQSQNNQEANFGFIAEASVSGKGAILQINNEIRNQDTSNFYYSINENNKKNFELKSFNDRLIHPIKISSNENNYFSTSGIWLFSSQFPKGTTSYKIVAIGQEDNKQLFSSVFENKAIVPFWESEAGTRLKQYLINRKFNLKTIEQLSYEKILLYWKSFINEELFKTFYKTAQANIEQDANISEMVSNFVSLNNNSEPTISKENAKKLLSLLLNDNAHLNDLELTLAQSSKNSDGTYNLKIDISSKNLKNKFENLVDQDSITILNFKPKTYENKEKRKIEIDELENQLSKNLTTEQVYQLLKKLPNSDKLNFAFEKENGLESVKLIVKPEYENDFYVSKKELFWKNNSFKSSTSNFINIFETLDLKQINLTGISDFQQAKEFVLTMIQQNWNNSNWKYGKDWEIVDFDNILLKAIKNIEKFDKLPHKIYLLKLRVLENLNAQIYGSQNIELVNIVGSLDVPKISNLSSIKLDNIKINTKNNPNFEIELKNKINSELLKNNLDLENFVQLSNFDEVINNFKNNPNLEFQNLKIDPLTFQLSGNNEIKIINKDFNLVKNNEDEPKNIFQNKKTYYWLIPVIIFSTIGLGFLIFWLYNKFIIKFKK